MAAAGRLFSRSFFTSLILSGSSLFGAEQTAARSAPTRPAASKAARLPTRMFARVEYVNLADVARELGLKTAAVEKGRKIVLTSGTGGRTEIEADTRDITVNGLRVFLGDPVNDAGGQLYVSRLDYELCLTPLLKPGHGVAPRGEPKIIALDPGHGGRDNGTSVHEKTFALDVAQRTEKLLAAAGYRVVLTRSDDRFLELKQRPLIANAARADLFVSIHFNALRNDTRTSGVEIYTFAPAKQHATGWWHALGKEDPDLETTNEPVNRFDHWSVVLAQEIHRRFVVDLKAFDRGKKLAHYGMLRGLTCPGVLVECGFLTSEVEARKIATPEHRQKLAQALAAGIKDYAAILKRP